MKELQRLQRREPKGGGGAAGGKPWEIGDVLRRHRLPACPPVKSARMTLRAAVERSETVGRGRAEPAARSGAVIGRSL